MWFLWYCTICFPISAFLNCTSTVKEGKGEGGIALAHLMQLPFTHVPCIMIGHEEKDPWLMNTISSSTNFQYQYNKLAGRCWTDPNLSQTIQLRWTRKHSLVIKPQLAWVPQCWLTDGSYSQQSTHWRPTEWVKQKLFLTVDSQDHRNPKNLPASIEKLYDVGNYYWIKFQVWLSCSSVSISSQCDPNEPIWVARQFRYSDRVGGEVKWQRKFLPSTEQGKITSHKEGPL